MKFFILTFLFFFLGVSLSLPLAMQYRNADADVDTLVATKEAAFGLPTAKVSAASVQSAADAFANDAMTVSSSLNSLGTATNAKDIISLATTAFKAESDEDQRRATLSKAAGSAGTTPNSKIVKNTPTVLTGLKNIMNSPTQRTTASNLATIENARNPQILPSITQLSNAAFKAVGMPQTATTFPATKGASLAANN